MKNILDKVSEEDKARGRRGKRRHQIDDTYLMSPSWVLVTQLYLGFIPL